MLRGLFTAVALLALSASTAHAQSLVKGKVVDAANKPVEGAVIHFEQKDANTKRDTKSDKKGEFIFVGLPSGDYKVTATKDGMTVEQPARVSQAEPAFVSFMLRPTAAPAAAGAAASEKAVAALTAGVTNESDAAQITAIAKAALEAYNAENNKEAVSKFNELVKKVPNCADCYMYLGISYFGAADPDSAEAALKKSIEIKPTAEAYNTLIRFYNQQKNSPKAEEMSKKLAELSAKEEADRQAAPATKGTPAAATPAAAVSVPDPAGVAYNEGVNFWNASKYAEAKAKFEEATKADPKNADAQYMLGMANLNLGQLPAARAAFQEYLKVSPSGDKADQVKGYLTQLPK
jgi:tetratricopeptide (TPR) repeat protein